MRLFGVLLVLVVVAGHSCKGEGIVFCVCGAVERKCPSLGTILGC